jgi:hypothetical protein
MVTAVFVFVDISPSGMRSAAANRKFWFGQDFASASENQKRNMRTLIALILWCILFVMCWPLALILLVLLPIVWLILLPFRIVGFTLEIVFKIIGSILLFPFRILKAN